MKSVHIVGWGDLKQYGINYLTGEACAYSMRLLCDLSEEGADLMRRFFGLPHNATFNPQWNSMVGDKPAVASVLLSRGLFDDLCRFILLSCDMDIVLKSPDGSWCGYARPNEAVMLMVDGVAENKSWQVYRNYRVGIPGDRNQHAFTGRTE